VFDVDTGHELGLLPGPIAGAGDDWIAVHHHYVGTDAIDFIQL
jgi:hypothetical protein